MKKSTTTMLAAAMLFGVTGTPADAQTRKQFGTGELPEFLKPYDLDNDGKLSVEERLAYEKAVREARPPRPGTKNPWDTNGDGVLSEEEKQAAREAIAAKMLEHRTKRFNELDKNSDGFLDSTELAAIPRITPEQVAAMIKHLDKDADGKISKEEFLSAMRPPLPPLPPLPPMPPYPLGRIPLALQAYDADKNGQISLDEWRAFVAAVDTNKDGRMSLDEWKAYVLAHPELLPPPPPPPAP
jgi:Ca2+-binding EF-hand superfamily protein